MSSYVITLRDVQRDLVKICITYIHAIFNYYFKHYMESLFMCMSMYTFMICLLMHNLIMLVVCETFGNIRFQFVKLMKGRVGK